MNSQIPGEALDRLIERVAGDVMAALRRITLLPSNRWLNCAAISFWRFLEALSISLIRRPGNSFPEYVVFISYHWYTEFAVAGRPDHLTPTQN